MSDILPASLYEIPLITDLPRFPFARPPQELVRPPLLPPDADTGQRVSRVALPTGSWAWLVTGHEDVRQMLRSPAFSANMNRPGFPLLRPLPELSEQARAGSFIRMDPPDHTLYRRILTPEFMIKNMRRLEPLIAQTVSDALDELGRAGPPADLIGLFALPVPSIVICQLLGVPYADHDFFQQHSRTLLNRGSTVERARQAAHELREYLHRLIVVKQAEGPTDDLLGRLAVERLATGEITSDELVGIALLLLVAGHETTANMIGLSTLVLLRHPEQFTALRDDPTIAGAAVEELLRYLTIVRTGLPRLATEDVEIGGQLIRAGEGAIAMLAAANRDDAVFDRPDEFDIERGSHQHVAFGFGVHQCIGQPLARAELRIALVELVSRFPGLRLAIEPAEIEMRDDSVVFGVQRLPVAW
jgi:cytochrome P450